MLNPMANDPVFEETLRKAREGRMVARGELLETCRWQLWRMAVCCVDRGKRGRIEPDDFVQETLLKALERFGQFRGRTEAELMAWLRQVLRRTLIDWARVHRRDQEPPPTCAPGPVVVGPAALAEQNEICAWLAGELAKIPRHHRQVLILRTMEGCSWDEVGRVMARGPDAARKLWARALLGLRQTVGAA